MKKKIIEALKNKYKNLGFSDKAFDGVAAYLEPSIKEEADIETAIAGVEGLLKSFQGETDKLRTDKTAAEKRLSELEAKVKELGGTPDPTKKEPDPNDNNPDTPAWAKVLIDSNKALSDRLAAMEGEKVVSSRKQKLDAIVGKLPENLRKAYTRTSVKELSDEEFEALTTEITTEVEGLASEVKAKGSVFGRPAGSNGGQGNGTLSKEQEAAIAKREGATADGQPF